MNWVEQAWADLFKPVVYSVSPAYALYDAYGQLRRLLTPEEIEIAIQSNIPPAAPRSRAEMRSGEWTPEDALFYAQQEALNRIVTQNANRRRTSSTPIENPVPIPQGEDDWTLYYVLGAVAATGILIAIVRK